MDRKIIDKIVPAIYRENRKISSQGNGLSIYIPSRIAQFYGLRKGDPIDIEILNENTMQIKLKKSE